MIKNTISNGSIANTVIMVILILVLFMLFPGCGLLDDDSSGGCGDKVNGDTPFRYSVTKSDLKSGASPYFICDYQKGEYTSWVEFIKIYDDCRCVEDEFGDDLLTAVYGYVPKDKYTKISGYYELDGKQTEFLFKESPADTDKLLFSGYNGWLDLKEEDECEPLKVVIRLEFLDQGTHELNIDYVVDSIKFQLQFSYQYYKPE